jgi:type IV secretory pathway protease TraF
VWINQVWVAPIAESWHGVALPILRGCWTLAPEELFLLSTTHPANFDSRYFGSVLRTQLDREAIPIWTRE